MVHGPWNIVGWNKATENTFMLHKTYHYHHTASFRCPVLLKAVTLMIYNCNLQMWIITELCKWRHNTDCIRSSLHNKNYHFLQNISCISNPQLSLSETILGVALGWHMKSKYFSSDLFRVRKILSVWYRNVITDSFQSSNIS